MMRLTPLPGSLRSSHPVAFIATWFGSGLMPKAPGTWGSLTAIPFAYIIYLIGGPVFLLVAAIIAFVIGIWASAAYALAAGSPSSGQDAMRAVLDAPRLKSDKGKKEGGSKGPAFKAIKIFAFREKRTIQISPLPASHGAVANL